ncbi:AAA domain-containing protein [Geosporobacter ferrireducens]|uniref:AAA domain-containing protein n=1 Tax=Geosporobacter ferrireducens TaxID=1424294 RepID=UPI00139B519E|nr:AAA domain-containing protein [Geosporobacter ferrireducens]MTI57722.1 DUF2726 domain-containing protein [Geosporobacter ferrireducens]
MDQDKFLIILKGKDKTSKVVSYDIEGSSVDIEFLGGAEPYTYSIENVVIKENPTVIDVTNKAVYCKDIPIYGIKYMLDFSGTVKIIFNKEKSQIYDFKSLRIEDNSINTDAAKDILKYWTEISQYTNTDDESGAFLRKEYEKLKFVSLNSVLGCYINKEPIKNLPFDTNNIIFPFKFNLSQKQAMENALKSNISVIEGPPGTGKTQTILNIIANLAIMQNKTVAVVSGNNAAVKNVKDKLEKDKYNFFVAPLGNNKNKESFFSNLPQYDISDWNSDIEESELLEKINGLNSHINNLLELNRQKAKIQQRLSTYLVEKQHFEIYYSNQKLEGIKRLSFYRKAPEKIISFLVDSYFAKENGKSDSILYKLKLLVKYGFTDFKSLKEKEIDIILNLQREYYNLKIESLEKEKEDIQNKLDKGSFDDLLEQHEEYSTVLFKHKLYKKYHGKKIMDFKINTYRKNFDKFIETFPIMLSTTHSLRNCVPENYLFDYLIIDESSQVDLLTGVLSLSCCKNAIIVGDIKQLPQIVDQAIQDKISTIDIEDIYNYFKQNILSSMLSLYGDTLPRVILKEHYRCHPKIIGFCNQKYYNDELIPFTKENEDDEPLILYRAAEGNHMRDVTRGERKGKFNQRELDVTVEEVLKNPRLCVEEISDIGFTTPYRKQVEKADSMLDDEIECDTIHKYQGREKPVMIMSTVLDNSRSGKIGIPFVDDPCKINVAVSRAQKQFVLVTHNWLFNEFGKEVSDLIRYMEYNTLDENIIDSEIVSVFDLLYKEYSDKLISFKSRLTQNSKYQSENIMWTLLNDIVSEDRYNSLEFTTQVFLKNLLNNTDRLNNAELNYVNRNASVDFVVYHKLNKQPILIVEVDGFTFHENNPEQLERDKIKNSILSKYDLPLIRLATTGSGEEAKVKNKLDELLNND